MRRIIVLAAAFALVVEAGFVAAQAQKGEKLEITAFAINMGTTPSVRNAMPVDITINSWSSPEERDALIKVMLEKGPNDLLNALQDKSEKGRFRFPTWQGPDPHQLGLGRAINYAWQVPLENGGRRITLITDRYIGFEEVRQSARTMDYPFTFIQIQVDAKGQGVGKFAVATRIEFDKEKKKIELENWGSEPVRLNELKVKVKN